MKKWSNMTLSTDVNFWSIFSSIFGQFWSNFRGLWALIFKQKIVQKFQYFLDRFWTIFGTIFGTFPGHFRAISRSRGSNRPPTGRCGPPKVIAQCACTDFGEFWSDFGPILVRFWSNFGDFVVPFWIIVSYILPCCFTSMQHFSSANFTSFLKVLCYIHKIAMTFS